MSPDQVQLLRRLAIKDREAMNEVMSGDLESGISLDPRTASLIRIAALVCVGSDHTTFQWATELGLAAGLDDGEIFDALMVLAPIVGVARLNSALPNLMDALNLEIVES